MTAHYKYDNTRSRSYIGIQRFSDNNSCKSCYKCCKKSTDHSEHQRQHRTTEDTDSKRGIHHTADTVKRREKVCQSIFYRKSRNINSEEQNTIRNYNNNASADLSQYKSASAENSGVVDVDHTAAFLRREYQRNTEKNYAKHHKRRKLIVEERRPAHSVIKSRNLSVVIYVSYKFVLCNFVGIVVFRIEQNIIVRQVCDTFRKAGILSVPAHFIVDISPVKNVVAAEISGNVVFIVFHIEIMVEKVIFHWSETSCNPVHFFLRYQAGVFLQKRFICTIRKLSAFARKRIIQRVILVYFVYVRDHTKQKSEYYSDITTTFSYLIYHCITSALASLRNR